MSLIKRYLENLEEEWTEETRAEYEIWLNIFQPITEEDASKMAEREADCE